jgi:hypothetical protein
LAAQLLLLPEPEVLQSLAVQQRLERVKVAQRVTVARLLFKLVQAAQHPVRAVLLHLLVAMLLPVVPGVLPHYELALG